MLFVFADEVTGNLASREELAAGASIGRVGLELPPRSPIMEPTPRADAPGLERGIGEGLRLAVLFVLIVCVC